MNKLWMGRVCLWSLLGTWLLSCQLPSANSQVVFLPEYSQFRMNSSFFVPDGGSLYGGGVSRFSQGSRSQGVPGLSNVPGLGRLGSNRSTWGSAGGTGVTTQATIYNMREIGDGILAGTHDRDGNLISPPAWDAEPSDTRSGFQNGPSFRNGPGFRNGPSYRNGNALGGRRAESIRGGEGSTNTGGRERSAEEIQRKANFMKQHLGRN